MSKFNSRYLSHEVRQLLGLAATLVAIALATAMTGCASINRSLKGLVGGSEEKPKMAGPRYSDQDNLRYSSDKKYRRMNKSRFEDEAEVNQQAGSLWVMEGQGAYLFAQNQTRVIGDLLNVRVEGAPRSQLQGKVKVISKLLERLEAPLRSTASTNPKAAAPAGDAAAAPAAAGAAPGAPAGDAAAGEKPGEKVADKNDPIGTIQTVPTRIVEQLKDGSYRVKGVQPFMIGKREYRVIVTGVVRPEDFDDAGIDSTKLLDSQFDIVSARKGTTL